MWIKQSCSPERHRIHLFFSPRTRQVGMPMIPWIRWRERWGEQKHGLEIWPKVWRTCWHPCPHVSTAFSLPPPLVQLQRWCWVTAIHVFFTGQKRRQDPSAEIRRISDGENFRQNKTLNWSKCFSISFVSSAPLLILIFGSRSPEEVQVSSDGPTGGGKAAPAPQYPVGQSSL